MKRFFPLVIPSLLFLGSLVLIGPASVAGQDPGTPGAAPACMVGVEIQPLAQAMPSDAGDRAMVVMRLTIAPDGGFDVHTHPGIVTASVDSGHLTFTQIDEGEMVLNRADGTTEPILQNKEVVLDAGDWLVEGEDMLHEAWNRSDQPTVVIVSGLVDPSLPFVQCAE